MTLDGSVLTVLTTVAAAFLTHLGIEGFRRIGREGRLLSRIEKLSRVLAQLPESPEKTEFGDHVLARVRAFNQWASADQGRARFAHRIRWTLLILLSLGAVVFLTAFDPAKHGVVPWVLSSIVGVLLGTLNAVASVFIDRRIRRTSQLKIDDSERERQRLRLEDLEAGRPPRR
jgi:hypothetical protein